MVREEDIRTAFSRVREDINDIKRSINKNTFRIDDLSGIAGQLTTKEEFYAFVEKLNTKLDQYEKGFADKKEFDKFIGIIKERVDSLKDFVDKREHLIDQIREIQKVKGKLADLQGDAATKAKVREEVDAINGQISEIKKHLSEEATIQKYDDDLKEFRDILTELTKDSVSWKELQKATKSLESRLNQEKGEISSLKESITGLESEAVRIQPLHDWLEDVKSTASRLDQDVKSLKNETIQREQFEEKIKELKSEVSSLRSKIEGSLVETDLNEYATKEQLKAITKRVQSDFASTSALTEVKQAIKSLEQNSNNVSKTREDTEKLRKEIESLQKQIVPEAEIEELSDDVKQLGIELEQLRGEKKVAPKYAGENDIKKLKEEIATIMSDIRESSESAKQLNKDISQLKDGRKEFAKEAKGYAAGEELKKLKDDVSYIMNNMAGTSDIKQQEKDFASEITALRNEIKELRKEAKSVGSGELKQQEKDFASDIAELRNEIKDLRKETKVSIQGVKTEAKAKPGIIAKVSKATVDFFTEEEEEKPKEEEKEEGGSGLLIIGIIALLVIVAGISFYMAGQNRGQVGGTITTSVSQTPEASATAATGEAQNITEQPIENQTQEVTQPTNITLPAVNITENITVPIVNISENITVPAGNISENITAPANVTAENVTVPSVNVTIPIVNVTGNATEPELTQEQLKANCIKTFECKQAEGGSFYDCYYDNLSKECRCYTGQSEKCSGTKPINQTITAVTPWYKKIHFNFKYALIAFTLGLIAAVVYYSFKGKGDEKKPKNGKKSKEEDRPAKKPIDEEVIDLKEFFEEEK
jgi:DNA repair exonuclease SbcCD ATPase subunit